MLVIVLAGCGGDPGAPGDGTVPVDPCVDQPEATSCGGSCEVGFTVPSADPTVVADRGIAVEIDPGAVTVERLPRTRPVLVEGLATVTVSGPFELLRADGTPLAGDVTDETVLVRATGPGAGAMTFAPREGCSDPATSLALTAVEPAPFAGAMLDRFPSFDVDHALIGDGDPLDLRVDAEVYFDRAGLPFDAALVRHRTPAEWAADPTFGDAELAQGSVTGVAGPAWSAVAAGPDLVEAYDVVLDFGADGRLDPGDLVDGFDRPAIAVAADLSAPGPYTPVSGELSGGFWLTSVAYSPQEVDQLDPMPLVVISHGNGHDFAWYDWLGEHLASHGYVVISHRNDTMPGPVAAADTTSRNTEWFLENLPTHFGGLLDGEVDPTRIVWIGHSRGGEGVVIAYDQLVTEQISPSSYGPDDVVLVSSIAPTVFESPGTGNPHGVDYHLLAGSADGDVTGGVDNPVTQYFRLFQRATGLRTVTYLQGADHNDFNCCGADDGLWVPAGDRGPQVPRGAAQQLAKAYYLAMLEATFRDRGELWEYLTRAPEGFRPAGTQVVVTSQLRRADGDRKLVVDDFQENPDPGTSSSGGRVDATVRNLVEGPLDDGNSQLTPSETDPMNGMSQSEGDLDPERGVVFDWDDGDDSVLEFALPTGEGDLSAGGFVSLRACQATRDPHTSDLAGMLSFSVALVDADGTESAVDHAVYGRIPSPYRRGGLGIGTGWSNEFQTIRIPVTAFAREGRPIDLARIRAVRLRFGAAWGSASGRIGLDDVEILEGGAR